MVENKIKVVKLIMGIYNYNFLISSLNKGKSILPLEFLKGHDQLDQFSFDKLSVNIKIGTYLGCENFGE